MENNNHKAAAEIPSRIFQEYLEALAEPADRGITREERILLSFAEVQFHIHGGGKCSICRASVRHVLPVHAHHNDGTEADFDCLCTRCLTGERAISDKVVMQGGKIRLEYGGYGKRPVTHKFRAIMR